MKLIVFTGLPATGKSSVAEAVGRELQILVFAKNWRESALRRAGLAENTGYAGYELLTTLAERQLKLGQSAVLDSVASITAVRDQWRTLAQTHQAKWYVVEADYFRQVTQCLQSEPISLLLKQEKCCSPGARTFQCGVCPADG